MKVNIWHLSGWHNVTDTADSPGALEELSWQEYEKQVKSLQTPAMPPACCVAQTHGTTKLLPCPLLAGLWAACRMEPLNSQSCVYCHWKVLHIRLLQEERVSFAHHLLPGKGKKNYHKGQQQGTVYSLQAFVSCKVARNTSTTPSVTKSILGMRLCPLSRERHRRGKRLLGQKGFKSCVLKKHRKCNQPSILCLEAAHPRTDSIPYCLFLMFDV